MSFKGLLNRTCVIERKTPSIDAKTGEKTFSWNTEYAGVLCRIRLINSADKISGSARYNDSTHILYASALDINTALCRVVLDGEIFSINGLSHLGGEDKYIALFLSQKK